MNTPNDAGKIREKIRSGFNSAKSFIRDYDARISVCVHKVVNGYWATTNFENVGNWLELKDQVYKTESSEFNQVSAA